MITTISLMAASLGGMVQTLDPSRIAVPNIAADTRPFGKEDKFFVFHQQATSFDVALTDFRFCFRYANQGLWNPPPEFVPWVEASPAVVKPYAPSPYGLVGDLMGSFVSGGLERGVRQTNMTACMIPRGYARYRVSEGLWRELNGKNMGEAASLQATIASGPTPPTPRILP